MTQFLLAFAGFVGLSAALTLGDRFLRPIEAFGLRLAHRKALSICLVVVATLVLRVSLLRLMPVPVPEIHDEFSYLLAGDTFAHGRMANPPHAMWIYFDTFHVNQHPTYVSMFPPAQGAVLALGELLGRPWIGVLLSCAAMCGAIVWMLQGWLAPRWAFLGGILALLHIGISSYWMNSYWGGAVAGIGGAFVVGALPRVIRRQHPRDAIILGVGSAILANSRPFEGLIFSIPVYIALAVWLFRERGISAVLKLRRVVVPLSLVLLVCGAFMLRYNAETSGSPVHFAHAENIQQHLGIPQLAWEKDRPPFRFSNPQFEAFYNVWWPRVAWPWGRPYNLANIATAIAIYYRMFVKFFLWPELCIPLIALPWLLVDRRMRLLSVQWAISFAGLVLVAWFQPHYVAALTATTFAVVVQGIRRMRQWRVYGQPLGIGLSRAVLLMAVILAPFHTYYTDTQPTLANRARIATQLNTLPGGQLVIVRYAARHDPRREWVYNGADIDRSKIVWAREIPGVSTAPLLDYFRDRKTWLVEPDSSDPQISVYSPRQGQSEEEVARVSSVTKAENTDVQAVHGR